MIDLGAVTTLVERVAYHLVLPRFGALVDGDVSDKGHGDLVTVVDTAAEAELAAGLAVIAPDVPVIGEEAVAADPTVLDRLAQAPRAFLVDPIDGTRAFVEGQPDYSVMVALVVGGQAVAGWICLPSRGHTWVAEHGGGAYRDGVRLAPPVRDQVTRARVAPAGEQDAALLAAADRVGGLALGVGRPIWAGRNYVALVDGEVDALGYWSGYPWDHAPGSVLVREIGGTVTDAHGADYRPTGRSAGPILAAANPAAVERLREVMAARHR